MAKYKVGDYVLIRKDIDMSYTGPFGWNYKMNVFRGTLMKVVHISGSQYRLASLDSIYNTFKSDYIREPYTEWSWHEQMFDEWYRPFKEFLESLLKVNYEV